MGTFSGPQAKGAQSKARRLRREQAERRNERTPLKRRRSFREATARRQQRPKQEPAESEAA